MIDFICDNIATIIIGLVLLSAVIIVFFIIAKRKKSGKTSCGSSCSDCPMKNNCNRK